MNNYITLDGYKYATGVSWLPTEDRPMVIKRLFSGGTNVTFGPASYKGWKGSIMVDATPKPGYGSIENIRTTYRKLSGISFTDHLDNTCTVVMDRSVSEKSLSPMWTAEDNSTSIIVALIKI
jgi:hypothetical protein